MLATVLVGFLGATLTASVTTPEAPASITVPSAAIGDRAVYARFLRDVTATRDVPPAAWRASGLHSLEVRGDDLTLDRDGTPRHVVQVEERTPDRARRYHVDVHTGSTVRTDETYRPGSKSPQWDSFFHRPDGVRFFPHGDQTYSLGQSLPWAPERCVDVYVLQVTLGGNEVSTAGLVPTDRDVPMRAGHEDCRFEPVPFFGLVEILERQRAVRDVGEMTGRFVMNVRSTATFRVPDTAWGELVTSENVGSTFTWTRDEWVSAAGPYPLLVQDEFVRHEQESSFPYFGRQLVLQAQARGDVPIQWGVESIAERIERERTRGDSHHPGDGQGSTLAYPLARALADVGATTAPPTWKAWSASHPEARLVAARLSLGPHSLQGPSDARSHQWSFIFATPDGRGREVATERFAGAPHALVRDNGDKATPTYRTSDLVPHQLTLSAAESLWRRLARSEGPEPGPNFVQWGFVPDRFASSPECILAGYGATRPSLDPIQLRTLYIGRTNLGPCTSPPDVYEKSLLSLDSASGEVYFFTEARGGFGLDRPVLALNGPGVETASAWERTRVAPDLRIAVATTGSLLVLFLTLYFLPSLKAALAEASYVLGYARVRRDRLLDHRTRDAILETVRQDPGISMSELANRLGVGWGTIVHHVSTLQRHKILCSQSQGRHRRVFPTGTMDHSKQAQRALLRSDRARRLYEWIQETPGIIQDQLARRLGVTPPAAYWHLRRLQEVGLVEKVRRGRHVRFYPRPAA